METKICAKCKDPKPVDQFKQRSGRPEGQLEPYCPDCKREINRLKMAERREANTEYHKKWSEKRKQQAATVFLEKKVCSGCDTEKPIEQFPPSKVTKDKHMAQCYECVGNKMNIWKAKNWTKVLYRSTLDSSKKNGYQNELSEEFLQELYDKQQGRCYWLGIELLIDSSDNHPARPSIDRLDCSKGYIRDNVVMTSRFANLGRRDTEQEVFAEFLKQIKKV